MADFADLYRKQMMRDAMADPSESPMMRDVVQAQFQTPNALGPVAAFMGSMANVKRGGQNRFGSLEQLYKADMQRKSQETAQEDGLLMQSANEIANFVENSPGMSRDQINSNIWQIAVKHHGSKAKDYYGQFKGAAGPGAAAKPSKEEQEFGRISATPLAGRIDPNTIMQESAKWKEKGAFAKAYATVRGKKESTVPLDPETKKIAEGVDDFPALVDFLNNRRRYQAELGDEGIMAVLNGLKSNVIPNLTEDQYNYLLKKGYIQENKDKK